MKFFSSKKSRNFLIVIFAFLLVVLGLAIYYPYIGMKYKTKAQCEKKTGKECEFVFCKFDKSTHKCRDDFKESWLPKEK